MNEIEIIGDFIHNILEAWEMFFTVMDEMVSNSDSSNLWSTFFSQILKLELKKVRQV